LSGQITPDAWITVSREALKQNFSAVQSLLAQGPAPPPQLIAVVKANAFGHGAIETAKIFQEAGADFFAVTTPDEALELRQSGISGRILVFLPALHEQIEALIDAACELTVGDDQGLKEVVAAADRLGKVAAVHLKVDTGMGRLGALPTDVPGIAAHIHGSNSLRFEGIYTHFARALEKDDKAVRQQFATFQSVLEGLKIAGVDPGLRHCANSAAFVRFPEMRLDAVRPGTILYGQYPSAAVPRALKLEETWRMQARIVAVRRLPAGSAIGYGGEFVTRRPTTLAVLPIGYADGFTVAPASASTGWRGLKALLRPQRVTVSVRGKRAPVIGRVGMQICSVDVTDIPGIAVGDMVTLPARRLTASARLPRLYEDRFP